MLIVIFVCILVKDDIDFQENKWLGNTDLAAFGINITNSSCGPLDIININAKLATLNQKPHCMIEELKTADLSLL